MNGSVATRSLDGWFAARGWTPSDLQRRAWKGFAEGRSGLIHAPTGVGKTLAAWGGAVEYAPRYPEHEGLAVLWLTPLRALARDTVQNLQRPLHDLDVPWRVEARIGDTSSTKKARQRTSMPHGLVTTPESLSVLMSYPEARSLLTGVHAVVVDEWHELIGSKRGTQTELALARLRRWIPALRIWGLSATLGNAEEAMATLLGRSGADPAMESPAGPAPAGPAMDSPTAGALADPPMDPPDHVLLRGPDRPDPEIVTLLPERLDRFPWHGHIGLALLPKVLTELEKPGTALLFTNTRAQSERWHEAIVAARPDWEGQVALHHGSLSRAVREAAEAGLADGTLRCVVATSSLDLGIDFGPVDRVVQVGSPKGIARLLQRAGRSGHTPDGRSKILCVPTQAIEVAEFAAARRAVAERRIEPRTPVDRPLDVLVQHMVTVAAGGGFDPDALFDEVRTSHAYRNLEPETWRWCLDFVRNGGDALRAYERFARVRVRDDGRWVASSDRTVVRNHRMSIGTITSDGQLTVQFLKGGRLGTVEESFLARLSPGDVFTFAGRRLRLVRIRDMKAYVRLAGRRAASVVPKWTGGRMPISSELGEALLDVFDRMAPDGFDGTGPGDTADNGAPSPELAALTPLLELQHRWSALPGSGRLLVERIRTREGSHLFLYPFLGRRVHDGLSALLAHRIAKETPATIHISANDYGLELVSSAEIDLDSDEAWSRLLCADTLEVDLLESLNGAELGKRQFREIARVAGLVLQGFPGRSKSTKALQVSSGLIYEVLERYDPDNLLLDQTRTEVLRREIEFARLREGLLSLQRRTRLLTSPLRLTPLAFPIWAERIQAHLSTESWVDRVRRTAERLEAAAGVEA